MHSIIEEIHDLLNDNQQRKISLFKVYWILSAVKWRYKKYWKVWLSKKEFEKFNITEARLYRVIKTLVSYWFLEFKETARNKNKQICYVYDIWKEFVEEFIKAVRNFSNKSVKSTTITERITEWCKKTDVIDFIEQQWALFWIKFKKRSQKMLEDLIYCNRKLIRDFKNDKTYNLFNYIKKTCSISTYDLALKLNIIW